MAAGLRFKEAMTALLRDVRYALRTLWKRPAFTALAVAALGLCIGANTAIFGVIDAALLKALPYRDAGRLVAISEELPDLMAGPIPFSAPDYRELERRNRSFEALGAYRSKEYELSGLEKPERLQGARISASLFPMLGIAPALGRNFTEQEDRASHRVVILSNALWQSKFGAKRGILGRSIILDRASYTVVGVMPRNIIFPLRGPRFNNDPAAFYVPISFTKDELQGWGTMFNHSVVGRLRPGVTLARANAELNSIAHRLATDIYPPEMRNPAVHFDISAMPFREAVVGNERPMLLLLFGAVGLVLLIGCADVAGLLLTRAAGRDREMSIRTAVGATRGQLISQVLVESLVLAVAGGVLGLILCSWAGGLLVHATGATLPTGSAVHLNTSVLLFTLAISIGTALIFGMAPALRASQVDVRRGMRDGGRGQSAGQVQGRMLDSLVTAQFALALLLLVGAGLLLRSLSHLAATDPGFRPDHIVTLSVSLPCQAYKSGSDVRAFYDRLDRSLATLPGIKAAAMASSTPLHVNEHRTFTIAGQPKTASSLPHKTAHIWVAGDFFRAMGIPLERGRFLDGRDTQKSMPAVVVNETLAREFWRHTNPIGQQIRWGLDTAKDPWMTVVGVVGDVKQGALDEPIEPETYSPWVQVKDEMLADDMTAEFRRMTIVARTANAPSAEAPAIERVIHRLDSSLPVTDVTTMDAELRDSFQAERLQTTLLGGFALAALVLAALGIGGVLAYSVAQRASEIGIRMALGASRGDVLKLILRRGMRLATMGTLIGLAGALPLAGLVSKLLYETSPYDALTFCAVPAFLCAVGLLAVLVPAARAASIDPVRSLRAE